jgi:hypothetical protein
MLYPLGMPEDSTSVFPNQQGIFKNPSNPKILAISSSVKK